MKVFIEKIQKMDNSTYYQKNRDIILKRAKDYYYNNIDTIRK